jgi:hypothetical protein
MRGSAVDGRPCVPPWGVTVRTAVLIAAATVVLGVSGCGSSPAAVQPAAPPPAPAAASGAEPDESGCPLSAEALSSATGMTWALRMTEPDHELETLPGVKADVCVLTSDDRPQQGGDPLVMRVDTAEGADATKVRTEFEASCSRNGGTATDSSAATGARICTSEFLPEALLGDNDRVVEVYYVAADQETAKELAGSFDKVLAAVQ